MDPLPPASPRRASGSGVGAATRVHAGALALQSSFSIQPEHDVDDLDVNGHGSGAQDKFAHTRGKRKRTSREDFAILEAEYQRNSRPDKGTRASIVARVSMTEKEVQIWFQNRRQMTRRKCRTWQPNEITSIIRSSQEQNVVGGTDQQGSMNEEASQKDSDISSSSQLVEETGTDCSLTEPSHVLFSRASSQALMTEGSSEAKNGASNVQSSLDAACLLEEAADSKIATLDAIDAPPVEENAPQNLERRRELKRKSSAVRLSLSFDGKAEVVVGSDSPSPPKKPALGEGRVSRIGVLQRSQSAITPAQKDNQPLGMDIPGWRHSRALGRSRDARTWEFYCDSDARNVLTKNAEHDQKGSAQAVLGLIRSGSNARKPLTPVKRENISLQRSESVTKKTPASRAASRGKLSRAMSSVARLQTTKAEEHLSKPAKSKLGGEVEIWEDNFGDSDKENQDPDEDGTRRCGSSSAGLMHSDPLLSTDNKENQGNKPTSISSKSSRPDDELDAVQNLLRLSQGAWC